MANRKTIYTDEMQVLTARIKQMRQDANMTQHELAKRLGKRSHTAILKLEQGQVRIELLELRRICLVCGIPFREFIERVEIDLANIEQQVKAVDNDANTP